jgi:hypothetical protein
MRKTFLTMLALAIAIAFSPLPQLQAAPLANPGSQPVMDNLAHAIAAKKKGKKKKAAKKKGKKTAKSKGCKGEFMYAKKGKCMDARQKKG